MSDLRRAGLPWGRRVRTAVTLSLVLWGLSVAIWGALLSLEHATGCPGLTDPSGFASKQSWHWIPLGERCVYAIDGAEHVDSPSAARLAVLGLLVVWPVATLGVASAARKDAAERVR